MRLSLEQSKSLAKWIRKYHPRSVGAEEVGEPDLGELDFAVRGDDMRERHSLGESIASLAREYGVSHGAASKAIRGITWAH